MSELYVCKTSVLLPVGSGVPKWPTNRINYAFAHYLPTEILSRADQEAITRENWDTVEAVCGLKATFVDDVNDAHVVYSCGRGRRANLDGPGKTLAYCYLPINVGPNYRNRGQVGAGLVVFDMDEPWVKAKPYGRRVGYKPVNWHEACGHGTGLEHVDQQRDGENIMEAIYDPNVETPGRWEIDQLRQRYGAPGTTPTQPPVVPPSDSIEVQVRVGGTSGKVYAGSIPEKV